MSFFLLSHPRCYHEDLANKTIDEVRQIYSNYSDPHCTPYKPDSLNYNIFGVSNTDGDTCDRWIYEFDHGYQSMSSEVSLIIELYFQFAKYSGLNSSIGSVTQHGSQQLASRCFSLVPFLVQQYSVQWPIRSVVFQF